MRVRPFVLAAALAVPLACGSGAPGGGPPVAFVPDVVVPDDLVGLIKSWSLTIYDTAGGIGCDAKTGAVTGNVAMAKTIANATNVMTSGCSGGAVACATLMSVPQQTDMSVVYVEGMSGSTKVAQGCGTAMINASSLSVSITLQRVLPTPNCDGSGSAPTPTFSCNDMSPVCGPPKSANQCQTVEELLSLGSTGTMTSTGSSPQKSNPFFLWPAGSASPSKADTAGALLAVFTDTTMAMPAIDIRVMDDTLSPPMAYGPAADSASIFVPNNPGQFPPMPPPDENKQPVAATYMGHDYVFFSTSFPTTSDGFNIAFDSFNQSDLTSDVSTPCGVNSASGHINSAPSVALSGSLFYVAWQDDAGNIRGRVVTPSAGGGCGSKGTETTLGTNGSGPKVAGAGNGWVVVWASSGSIKMQFVGMNGVPIESTKSLGSGSTPAVAALPSGTDFAVAWANGSDIDVERFDQQGHALATGGKPAIGKIGSGTTPAIAGGPSPAGNFYVAAWIASDGVRAQLLTATSGAPGDPSGQLFNNVDGTANAFLVNDPNTDSSGGRSPAWANPTVAVGGAGSSYIAFGWEDHGASCTKQSATFPGTPCFGIIARRFPVPGQ